jgi:Mrp family chromosome partitioning ATPase
MSRVYNALTGATRTATLNNTIADENAWETSEEAPFIEIGSPSGPLFSSASLAASSSVQITPKPAVPKLVASSLKPGPEIKAEDKPEPKAETLRTFPRLVPSAAAPAAVPAPATAYLSVKFHDVTVRQPRPATEGPDAALVTYHFPEHAVSGEYRVLRDEIRRQLPDSTARVLLFSAAAAEAGTTTVLLNLAVTLAQEGKTRVLVVDGNVTRPGVAAKLALKPAPGLCEVLAHRVPLAWAVQPSVVPSLQVLTAGEADASTPAELSRDLPKLLGQLREWYDWVLVDSGVWGMVPERDAASPAADAVYLVTRDANADHPEFLNLRSGVKEAGGLLRGYVATRA